MSLANEIIYGRLESVSQLILAGADVDALDEYGYTALIESAIVNKMDIGHYILENGANVNLKDVTDRTALHWTVDNNNLAFTQLLLDYKANPNIPSSAGQSALVYPLLRGQDKMKSLLYQYGADLRFSQDFINTKLIGHRYELQGFVHIVDTQGKFILLDFEGFFLEFSISVIFDSLRRYSRNFAAKPMRSFFIKLRKVIKAFSVAAELIKYQQYNVDLERHDVRINRLVNHDLLIIPAVYQGHAITFIRYGSYFAKCDRGANSQFEGSVVIYRMRDPRICDRELVKKIIYTVNDDQFMHLGINQLLGLETVGNLPIPSQVTGNCSWANVEATVPTLMFLLGLSEGKKGPTLVTETMTFFHEWREWDKDRALDEGIQRFYHSPPPKQASIAAMLAAVLFQACDYSRPRDITRAEKILIVLNEPMFRYVLKHYLEVYHEKNKTKRGENLIHLLDVTGFGHLK